MSQLTKPLTMEQIYYSLLMDTLYPDIYSAGLRLGADDATAQREAKAEVEAEMHNWKKKLNTQRIMRMAEIHKRYLQLLKEKEEYSIMLRKFGSMSV